MELKGVTEVFELLGPTRTVGYVASVLGRTTGCDLASRTTLAALDDVSQALSAEAFKLAKEANKI